MRPTSNEPTSTTARGVYLDNHSTTRVDPRVVEAMLPFFLEDYGNPSATGHCFGRKARLAVETARSQVSALIGAEPREVIFTSGATEANNLAIKGVAPGLKRKGDHLVSSRLEHSAVLDPLRRLAREGWRLDFLAVDPGGRVSSDMVAAALTDRTTMVSIMAAHNEVGTVNDVAGISRLCRERSVVYHCDATQAIGRIPFRVDETEADLVSFTAHKFHGPKGIGALVARGSDSRPRLEPLFEGGGQERGLRSGTLAVPLIVGFGKAAEIAMREREEEAGRLRKLRDRLLNQLAALGFPWQRNGDPVESLPGNLNISFGGVDGDRLHGLLAETGLAVSSGAACGSGNEKPSRVLVALGLSEALAKGTIRFGLGRFSTEEDIDFAVEAVGRALRRLSANPPTVPFRKSWEDNSEPDALKPSPGN